MRPHPLLLLGLLTAILHAQDETRIRTLVMALGDEVPSRREAAQRYLESLGQADASGRVEELLAQAARSTDPEVVERSRQALRRIRWWEGTVVFAGDGAHAFDLDSRRELWNRVDLGGSAQAWVWPLGHGARVYVASDDAGLECVDGRSGASLWRAKDIRGAGIRVGDHWFGIGWKEAKLLSLRTGEAAWSIPSGSRCNGNDPVVVGEPARIVFPEYHSIRAVDVSTGETLWRAWRGMVCTLAVVRGALIAVDETASEPVHLRRLDPADGTELWRQDFEGDCCWPNILDGGDAAGVVVVSTAVPDRGIGTVAIGLASGTTRWVAAWDTAGLVLEDDGTAWIASGGALRHVSMSDGRVLQTVELPYERSTIARVGRHRAVVSYNAFSPGADAVLWQDDDFEAAHLVTLERMSQTHGISMRYRQYVSLADLHGRLVVGRFTTGWDHLLVLDPAGDEPTIRHTFER